MNREQKDMIGAILEVERCMYTPSFTQDSQGLKNLIVAFEYMVSQVRTSIGQKAIKDYLNE